MISEQPATDTPMAVVGDPVHEAGERWRVQFPDGMQSMGGVMHGGVVVGTMARAAGLAAQRRPSTITAHLHSGVQPGEATIDVREVASGRTASTVELTLAQDRLRATAFVLVTDDDVSPGLPVTVAAQLPADFPPVPAADATVDRSWAPFARNGLDAQMVGDGRVLGGGDTAMIQAWLRPRVLHPDSSAVAAMLLDALPPALLVLRTAPALILTIEFSIHLTDAAHRPQRDGAWYFMRQHTVWAVGALSVDDAQLWSQDGQLIGTARQMRRTMPERPQ